MNKRKKKIKLFLITYLGYMEEREREEIKWPHPPSVRTMMKRMNNKSFSDIAAIYQELNKQKLVVKLPNGRWAMTVAGYEKSKKYKETNEEPGF